MVADTIFFFQISSLYYKHIIIVNDDSIMMLQVVASLMIVILMTLEMSFMLLANIYSRGVTHDDRNICIVQAIGCKAWHPPKSYFRIHFVGSTDLLVFTSKRCFAPFHIKHLFLYYRYLESEKPSFEFGILDPR